MKIGILTFHRAHNYGAVLQCYALQEILVRKGYEVEIIDYRQPWIEEQYKCFSISMLKRCKGLSEWFSYIKNRAKKMLVSPLRPYYYSRFRKDFFRLGLPCDRNIPSGYDFYVIGSDQLWSLHCLGGVSDDVYFGAFEHSPSSGVMAYAISADMASVEALSDKICSMAGNFTHLSMREKRVADKVSEISGKECSVCLDPTLLSDMELWEPLIDHKWKDRKYVLMYEVKWRPENKGLLRKKAMELAAVLGEDYEVIDLSSGVYSITDFVSLFRYAGHVVTTSFHGTVFSLIFERPFYVYPLWNGYDLRYIELLKDLGCHDRLLSEEMTPAPEKIDFKSVKDKLSEKQRSSLKYLDQLSQKSQVSEEI